MKVLTAHQVGYLPWLGLFHKLMLADTFCFFTDVQYQKREWDNRNYILLNGRKHRLTVPVCSKNHFGKKLADIKINNTVSWQKKHFKTIAAAYGKAAHYGAHEDFFTDVYVEKEWTYLADLNEYMFRYFCKYLGIAIEFISAKDYDFTGVKSELVLDMCRKIGCNIYVFGALGKDYAEIARFREHNISIYFQEYHHPEYRQFRSADFVPHLSIIDLLCNYGPTARTIIQDGNINKEELIRIVSDRRQD